MKEAHDVISTELFDVVIRADSIYNRELHAPLLRTLEVVISTRRHNTTAGFLERRGHEADAFLTSSRSLLVLRSSMRVTWSGSTSEIRRDTCSVSTSSGVRSGED